MKINNSAILDSPPKLIVFDLDNTLYPYKPAHEAAISSVTKKISSDLSISANDFIEQYKIAREEIKTKIPNSGASHSRLLYLKRTFELMGLESLVLKTLDLEQTYWHSFMANAELFEGVQSLLHEIALYGIKTAIITDLTTQVQLQKLIYFNLDNSFNYIVTSEEAGADKPDPKTYKTLTEKTGNISPVWMIGDDLEKDICGAQKHLDALGLLRRDKNLIPKKHQIIPDAEFTHFKDVSQLLKKINNANTFNE